MTATFPPPWAQSILRNYRYAYKITYGEDTKLTDTDIWDIYNTVFDDTDNKKQDEERVEEMRRREGKL